MQGDNIILRVIICMETKNMNKQKVLIVAVVAMYISFFLPLFVSKYNSDYHYSLWEYLKLVFEQGGSGYKIRLFSDVFLPISLFVLPMFHILLGVKEKKGLIIVALAQICLVWYFAKDFNTEMLRISIGTYGYVLGCVAVLWIGANDGTISFALINDISKNKVFAPIIEKEKKLRGTNLKDGTPIASKTLIISLFVSFIISILMRAFNVANITHAEFITIVILTAIAVGAFYLYPIYNIGNVPSNEKYRLTAFIMVFALIGSLFGHLWPILVFVFFLAWILKKIGLIK